VRNKARLLALWLHAWPRDSQVKSRIITLEPSLLCIVLIGLLILSPFHSVERHDTSRMKRSRDIQEHGRDGASGSMAIHLATSAPGTKHVDTESFATGTTDEHRPAKFRRGMADASQFASNQAGISRKFAASECSGTLASDRDERLEHTGMGTSELSVSASRHPCSLNGRVSLDSRSMGS